MFKYVLALALVTVSIAQASILILPAAGSGRSQEDNRQLIRQANADYMMQEQTRIQQEMLNEYRRQNMYRR